MQQIGRYEVQREVARGGMGVVYRALDPMAERPVAVKVLLDPQPDPRFLQEARALARLSHPGIVACHDLLRDEHGRDVLVMEWVEGESLKQRLERAGPLPVQEALDLTRQLCEALAYAHGRGVIHRDVKPHNVLLTARGRIKLTDFGLGKRLDRALDRSRASLTASGEIMGTPAYMPPEQAEGNKATMGPRSDVYAVGATLYALLTGQPPFRGATVINVLHAVAEQPAAPPSTLRPELPEALDALVLRCLAKRPDERFESMQALIAALAAVATPADPAAPPPTQRGARRPALLAAGLIGVGALAAGLLVLLRGPAEPTPAVAAPVPPADPAAALEEALARGYALLERNAWSETVAAGTEAIALAPEQARGWILRARGSMGLGDMVHARRDAEEAVRLDPQLAPAWALRAAIRMYTGEVATAILDYTRAIELDPNDPEWVFQRAFARDKHGELEPALEDADRAIELAPDQFDYHLQRGLTLEKLERREDALAAFERAVELAPTSSLARTRLASAAAVLRDLERAMAEYDVALTLEPQNGYAYAGRAKLHALAGRDRDALDDFDQAAARLTGSAALFEERAVVRHRVGDLAGALQDVERALRLRPDPLLEQLRRKLREALETQADAVTQLAVEGAALGRQEQYAEALETLNRAVALDPERPLPYLFRAQTFDRLGDVAAARADCERALGLAERMPADKLAMAYALRGRLKFRDWSGSAEDFEAAIADFTRAIELAPERATPYRLRGSARLTQGRRADAVQDLSDALARPDSLDRVERVLVLGLRGRAYAELGDDQAAVADWEQALELDPNATVREDLAQARSRLSESRD